MYQIGGFSKMFAVFWWNWHFQQYHIWNIITVDMAARIGSHPSPNFCCLSFYMTATIICFGSTISLHTWIVCIICSKSDDRNPMKLVIFPRNVRQYIPKLMTDDATYSVVNFDWGRTRSEVTKWLFISTIFHSIHCDISRPPPNLVENKATNFGVWTNLTYQSNQTW